MNKLNNFTWSVVTYSSSSLSRINDALDKINRVAKKDVKMIQSSLSVHKETFDSLIGNKVDHVLYFLDNADHSLDYLALRLTTGPRDDSLYSPNRDDKIMDYGWDAFTYAKGVFDILRISLLSIESTESLMSTHSTQQSVSTRYPDGQMPPDVQSNKPINIWSSVFRQQSCTRLFKKEADGYRALLELIHDALDNWYQLNDTQGNVVGWPGEINLHVAERKKKVDSLKSCVAECKDAIARTSTELLNIEADIIDILNAATSFDYPAFVDSIASELKRINKTAQWLHGQVERYSVQNITKLDMANEMFDSNIQEEINRQMETILFKIDLDAIFKLQTETQAVKSNIQNWFVSGLGAINNLADYFGENNIDEEMRKLHLWRKPVADLNSPRLLQYSYPSDENWRTWPISVSLRELVGSSGSRYISTILDEYMVDINEAMYQVKHISSNAKEEAEAAFSTLWTELNTYKLQSRIDDPFIRYKQNSTLHYQIHTE